MFVCGYNVELASSLLVSWIAEFILCSMLNRQFSAFTSALARHLGISIYGVLTMLFAVVSEATIMREGGVESASQISAVILFHLNVEMVGLITASQETYPVA